jgi:hypothetical protein
LKAAAAALLATALWLLSAGAAAQESDTSNQFWPEIDVYKPWNERMRSFLQISGTHLGDQVYGDGNGGLYLDYYAFPIVNLPFGHRKADAARGKYVFVRAGYNYSLSNRGQTDEPATNTIVAEGTARVPLPWGILTSDRSRFDMRWVGSDFQPRYRNRLRLERQFQAGKLGIDPYVHAEFFYDFDDGKWNRTVFTAGVEVAVSRTVTVETYYQRQNNVDSTPETVNGFGLVFQFYLR